MASSPQLKALAIDAFDLELLARDEALTLYRPGPDRAAGKKRDSARILTHA